MPKEIKFLCDSEQAYQLDAAIKKGGLVWPTGIAWAYYVGGNYTHIINSAQKFILESYDPKKEFIPCPTLSEIMIMSPFASNEKNFDYWFNELLMWIKAYPENLNRNYWYKLQEDKANE